jgi:signal transduction histidine kinase
MEDISLHILDIVENSLRANAKNVKIKVTEDEKQDLLTVLIEDDGEGMDKETLKRACDPFFTTKAKKRIGLGLSLLSQSAQQGGGKLTINSKKGKGTKICATFRLSNIDTKPLGNIDETIKVLRSSHPEVRFIFEYRRNKDAKTKT